MAIDALGFSGSWKAVAGVQVGGDGLRVELTRMASTPVLLERPDALDRAVVELDATMLADERGGFVRRWSRGPACWPRTRIDHLETGAVVRDGRSSTSARRRMVLSWKPYFAGLLVLRSRSERRGSPGPFQGWPGARILSRNHQSILVMFQMVWWSMPRGGLQGLVDAEDALCILHMQVCHDLVIGHR